MQVLPTFITFTGVDEATPLEGLKALSMKYPIEFGILVSTDRSGLEARYPRQDFVFDFIENQGGSMPLAAHLCGAIAREVVETSRAPSWFETIAGKLQRIQINTRAPCEAEILRAAAFGRDVGVEVIFQARGEFPEAGTLPNMLAQWLYDTSGGTGTRPSTWPSYRGLKLHGFAGGISPDNVIDVIRELRHKSAHRNFWIDMETGVRTDDRFDLEKCRAVCEKVYGHVEE